MYNYPQPYRCDKCGHECKYGSDDHHPAPVLEDGDPVCPKCWEEFLRANLGVMDCLTFPRAERARLRERDRLRALAAAQPKA